GRGRRARRLGPDPAAEEARVGSAGPGPAGRVPHTRQVIMNSADPRDPLGLAADAPLLAAWLDWMEQAESGRLLPMSTPGHKQRYDLVGTVVAGDAPLYGALGAIKHADRLRAGAEGRAAAPGGAGGGRLPG